MNDHLSTHCLRAKNDVNNFTFQNFEVQGYSTDGVHSYDPSTLSRYRNLLIKAYQRFNRLPKLIVIVFEDDIIRAIDMEVNGISQAYEAILNWLIKEHYRSILLIKEKLPSKSIREDWPHILYLAPTIHKYYKNDNLRRSFTRALESVARKSQSFKNMSTLRLREHWNKDDSSLYNDHRGYITAQGLSIFWQSLHSSIKHCIQKLDYEAQDKLSAEMRRKMAEPTDTNNRFKFSKNRTWRADNFFWKSDHK